MILKRRSVIDYYVNRDQPHHASYLMVYYMKQFVRLQSEYLVSATPYI